MELRLRDVWGLLLVTAGILFLSFKAIEFISLQKGGLCTAETVILALVIVAGTFALLWVRIDYVLEKKKRKLQCELNGK